MARVADHDGSVGRLDLPAADGIDGIPFSRAEALLIATKPEQSKEDEDEHHVEDANVVELDANSTTAGAFTRTARP